MVWASDGSLGRCKWTLDRLVAQVLRQDSLRLHLHVRVINKDIRMQHINKLVGTRECCSLSLVASHPQHLAETFTVTG